MFNIINYFKLFKVAVILRAMAKVDLHYKSIELTKNSRIADNKPMVGIEFTNKDGVRGAVEFKFVKWEEGASFKILTIQCYNKNGELKIAYPFTRHWIEEIQCSDECDSIQELVFKVKKYVKVIREEGEATWDDYPKL